MTEDLKAAPDGSIVLLHGGRGRQTLAQPSKEAAARLPAQLPAARAVPDSLADQ